MHPLEYAIRQTLLNDNLLAKGGRVLVGVSGGADSIALLHILAALRDAFSLTLVAAYIDHGLRPTETPAEWTCVREAAVRLGVECTRSQVNVTGLATAHKLSLEHAARDLRYQAFADLGRQWATDTLAVAHTADDQAEELLLRLFRGGGRKALSGMRLQSGTLIRPLLAVRKSELLAYLADQGIGFCFDSSNDNLRFVRNRIRHDLLPLLESQFDPGIRQALLKTAANLREDEDLLEFLLAEHWEQVIEIQEPNSASPLMALLRRDPFCTLHPALQRRMVEQLLWTIGEAARYEQIMAVVAAARSGRTGSELHLSRGLRVGVTREHLEFSYPQGRKPWRGRLHPV
ncbi:MAG: tRNA lysidine(34) synthetase TilS [Desulfobulbaceae bacterium]|nr:tRNA lysidine(34) synthetase TilS [Desulfobulbaceae bacterium]